MLNLLMHKLGLTKKITRGRLDRFLKEYATEKRTLDIGCGLSYYKKYFPNRVSFDIDEAKSPDVVGDAHKMPFDDGEFEVVLRTEVLEHLHTPDIAIKEMRRVLAHGGLLILTTRFIFPIHDAPNDYYRYTKFGLFNLFKDWEILTLKAETNTFESLAVLLQRLGYQTDTHFLNIFKVIYFIIALIIARFNFLIKNEYGDIDKKTKIDNIMSSGYYLVCRKQ